MADIVISLRDWEASRRRQNIITFAASRQQLDMLQKPFDSSHKLLTAVSISFFNPIFVLPIVNSEHGSYCH